MRGIGFLYTADLFHIKAGFSKLGLVSFSEIKLTLRKKTLRSTSSQLDFNMTSKWFLFAFALFVHKFVIIWQNRILL